MSRIDFDERCIGTESSPAELNRAFSARAFLFPQSLGLALGWQWKRALAVRSTNRKSKEQDKHAGDHQREHPDQIDVEPRAAQDRDAKFFVNHNRDQRSG